MTVVDNYITTRASSRFHLDHRTNTRWLRHSFLPILYEHAVKQMLWITASLLTRIKPHKLDDLRWREPSTGKIDGTSDFFHICWSRRDSDYLSPPLDNIWAMMFAWRYERRLSELFCVVLCTEAVHSHKHT